MVLIVLSQPLNFIFKVPSVSALLFVLDASNSPRLCVPSCIVFGIGKVLQPLPTDRHFLHFRDILPLGILDCFEGTSLGAIFS